MLVFDPIRAMSHDVLRIPPKLYEKSEAVVRLEESRELGMLQARRGGTLTGKLLQLSNIYSIDVCYNIVMVLKLSIDKEL